MTHDEPEDGEGYESGWHLNKSVPISIIVTLIIQAVLFAAFITKMDARIGALETKDQTDTALFTARFKLSDERWEKFMSEGERMARVEEQLKAQADTLHRIEVKIDATPSDHR